jgi:LPXTG-motif cell wall-anchored protein
MVRTPMRERLLAMLGIAAGTGLLAVGLATMPATAASVTPTEYESNKTTQDFGYPNSVKIDVEWDEEGDFDKDGVFKGTLPLTFTSFDSKGTVPAGLTITIDNLYLDVEAKTVYFDWAASVGGEPFLVQIVLVKAGDGGLAYVYGGTGVAADTELWSPRGSISHIDFGWGKTTGNGDNGNGGNGNGGTTPVTVTQPPTTTRQTIPFDEEPATVPPTVLPTIVEPTTTTLAPATVAPATEAPATTEAAEVLGVTVDRQLPRTGAASTALAQIGFGLLLVGAGLLAHSRRVAYDER